MKVFGISRNRRTIPGVVSFNLNRTELGFELIIHLCRPTVSITLVTTDHPSVSTYCVDHPYDYRSSICVDLLYGGASLEEMLEEENLEDATLVDVEVKAEP
ncbi:hypothetical protein LR48_Vigan02g219800 [Vigna angularis]|uniref:Uncharacterized protein n=1 Tax=Phaseolus angularis TaxID=3914 RepID=A0A0L9TZN5_PHAAN|nr:hypothetical protein LR48_Vigan02g219800 [Vigna angularis]